MYINGEKNYAEAGYLLYQMRKIFAYRAERRSESIGVLLVVMKMDTMMNVRTSFSVWNVQKKKDTKYRIVLMAYGKI